MPGSWIVSVLIGVVYLAFISQMKSNRISLLKHHRYITTHLFFQ